VTLVGPRNAFLLLVKNNVFGLAGRLTFADSKKRAQFWESFGGNNNKLNTAISQGKGKRAILSNKEFGRINGIGVEPATTTAAAIVAAAPILAVVAKLLGNMKTAPKLNADGSPVLDKNGNPVTTTGSGLIDLIKNVSGSEVLQTGLKAASEIVNVDEDKGIVETKSDVEIQDKDKGFKISTPILIGGAGLLALLLLRKK
jgi:hypothetical protein